MPAFRWASGVYSGNTSPAQAQDEGIYPRRLRQLLGRGWVTVHGPEFREEPFSRQKCLPGVGGSLTRFAPRAAALPRGADPSPHPRWSEAGGGCGLRGTRPARRPRPGSSAPTPTAAEKCLCPFDGLQRLPRRTRGRGRKATSPGDQDRPATPRERLQRLPRRRSSREGAARRAGDPQGRWPGVGTLNPRRGAGGRVRTHPQAAAPDPHVALLHDVTETGGHPGRPASPRAQRAPYAASGPDAALGWPGRQRRPSGGGSARRQEARIACQPASLEVGGRRAATSGSAGSRRGWGARVS